MPVIEHDDDLPVSVLSRGVSVLDCFDSMDRRHLTLADITTICRLPKPTVHRLLAELSKLGLVERSAGGYRLGMRLFELGVRVPQQISLREAAFPYVQDLWEATGRTVHLSVPDGGEVLVLAKFSDLEGARLPTQVGGRMPSYCTASGKVMIAHAALENVRSVLEGPLKRRTPHTVSAPGLLRRQLHEILETGLGHDREETWRGIVCVASPIFDRSGQVAAAVSVSSWATQFDPVKLGLAVRTAALGMTRALSVAEPDYT